MIPERFPVPAGKPRESPGNREAVFSGFSLTHALDTGHAALGVCENQGGGRGFSVHCTTATLLLPKKGALAPPLASGDSPLAFPPEPPAMPLHHHLAAAIQRHCGDTPDDIADTVAQRLADAGYSIQRDVPVQPRRGASDSIDIVATDDDTVIAVVVDRPKPADTPPSRRSQRWHLRLIRYADRLQPRHSYHPAVLSRRFRADDFGPVAFGLCS